MNKKLILTVIAVLVLLLGVLGIKTISNKNIQKLANSFSSHAVGSEIRTHKSIAPAIKSPGSKFFSQCFRAYVSQDYEFLSAVKSNFGESYSSFEEIISRLPNK
jgi:hypothetical protein